MTFITDKNISWFSGGSYDYSNSILTITSLVLLPENQEINISFGGIADLTFKEFFELENIELIPQQSQNTTPSFKDLQMILNIGESKSIDLIDSNLKCITNNNKIIKLEKNNNKLIITGIKNGRGMVKIDNNYFGVKVGNGKDENEFLIGLVCEDDPLTSLAFFTDFEENNKRIYSRYIYLNGGPGDYGWRLNYSAPEYNSAPLGMRAINYIRNSLKLGVVPILVYYNIADGGEAYTTDLEHIQNSNYMKNYFIDLKFLLDLINKENPIDETQIILEPDFIGYMFQNSGKSPNDIMAIVNIIYDLGYLNKNTDPIFQNNMNGLISCINYLISKTCPQVKFGWMINLWSNPVSIPGGNGIMKSSDYISNFDNAKQFIIQTASDTAKYYIDSGILNYRADFFSVDKYGLDYALYSSGDVKNNPWAFNNDHWKNYLLYIKTIGDILKIPCVLWQLPVGHLNSSLSISPYTKEKYTNLPNTTNSGEDSAVTFFFGDTFTSSNVEYWGSNKWNDNLTIQNNKITYKTKINNLKDYNIEMILFGQGVGISTVYSKTPSSSIVGDNYFLISKIQEYYNT